MLLIGDVHGKWRPYKYILARHTDTIQIGDLGIGFRHHNTGDEIYSNPLHYEMTAGNHRFIRGNHDNPGACRTHSQWIPDGTIEGDTMFVGGALSIDRAYRLEDYSWWADEELSIEELNAILDSYIVTRPRLMVTHECPESVADYVMTGPKLNDPSRTRQAFESMFYHHQPEMWVFGHWHTSFDMTIEGTRFVCLDELEVLHL